MNTLRKEVGSQVEDVLQTEFDGRFSLRKEGQSGAGKQSGQQRLKGGSALQAHMQEGVVMGTKRVQADVVDVDRYSI